MLKISSLVLFCILAFAGNSFAQACGRGYFKIELNITDTVNYELYSVVPKDADYYDKTVQKALAEKFLPNLSESGFFWFSMPKIENAIAEQFLVAYKAEDYKEAYGDSLTNGTSKDGIIHIKTWEAYSEPFLIKLSAMNYKTAYYLGSFLGGCKVQKKIDLEMAVNYATE